MNLSPLRALSAHTQSGRLASEADGTDPTAAMTELFLLEDCAARCESLAHDIAGKDALQPLMDELSECIAACSTYLAARARRSRHTPLLRSYCIEVLATAADALATRGVTRGSDCHRIIRASVRWLQGRAS